MKWSREKVIFAGWLIFVVLFWFVPSARRLSLLIIFSLLAMGLDVIAIEAKK